METHKSPKLQQSAIPPKTVKIIMFVILFDCLVCVVLNQIPNKRCFWKGCPPIRSFDILELELPTSFFPINAIYQPIEPEYDKDVASIELAVQEIEWNSGYAYYSIKKYVTFEYSISRFGGLKNAVIENRPISSLSYLDSKEILDLVADNSLIWCGVVYYQRYDSNRENCTLVLRYQEFVTYFGTTITKEMTIRDFMEVANFIDDKMNSLLYPN